MLRRSVLLSLLVSASLHAADPAASLRGTATDAARWIREQAVCTDAGQTWHVDPNDPARVDLSIYEGTAGVVLFYLEAWHATGDEGYLIEAKRGADHLLSTFRTVEDSSFYAGLGGVSFTLLETAKVTGEAKYRRGAEESMKLLVERAKPAGRGLEWNGIFDLLLGESGIGLFLLSAGKELNVSGSRDIAMKIGDRLIEVARRSEGGLYWPVSGSERVMPNFSHGGAGIGYFLAVLHRETGEKRFLDAALSAANHLASIALTKDHGFLVYHFAPGGTERYYLGYCHGPAGTSRLFYLLFQITGDRKWMSYVERSARSILASGIPEQQTDGFWNNVSVCCGSAGVASFFLDLHRITGKSDYLAFARRLTSNLLSRAQRDVHGARWPQAEHRIMPELIIAQTSYMQGAAGIGLWLLQLDAFDRGRKPLIRLPDTPF